MFDNKCRQKISTKNFDKKFRQKISTKNFDKKFRQKISTKHFYKKFQLFLVGDAECIAFSKTTDAIGTIISSVSEPERVVVSVVQFSGVRQLEESYQPGNNGEVNGLNMYKVEVQPTSLVDNLERYFGTFLDIFWTFFGHFLDIFCTFFVHFLYIFCTLFVHFLYIFCTFFVHFLVHFLVHFMGTLSCIIFMGTL